MLLFFHLAAAPKVPAIKTTFATKTTDACTAILAVVGRIRVTDNTDYLPKHDALNGAVGAFRQYNGVQSGSTVFNG